MLLKTAKRRGEEMASKEDEDRLQALAPGIAEALGWEVERKERDYRHYVEIVATEERRLGLSVTDGHGTMGISGRFPAPPSSWGSSWLPYDAKTPRINVSLKKTAEAIARDIERRLLPEYEPLLAEALRRRAEHEGSEDKAMTNMKRLAKVIGGKPDPERHEVNLYRSSRLPEQLGDIKVSSDSVTFDHFSVTVDEAEAMLSALIEARR